MHKAWKVIASLLCKQCMKAFSKVETSLFENTETEELELQDSDRQSTSAQCTQTGRHTFVIAFIISCHMLHNNAEKAIII